MVEARGGCRPRGLLGSMDGSSAVGSGKRAVVAAGGCFGSAGWPARSQRQHRQGLGPWSGAAANAASAGTRVRPSGYTNHLEPIDNDLAQGGGCGAPLTEGDTGDTKQRQAVFALPAMQP